MNKRKQTIKYIVCDYLSAAIAWCSLFIFRKLHLEFTDFDDINLVFRDANFIKGIIIVPFFWLFLYTIQGAYNDIFRKSRLKELGETFFISIVGVLLIFFALLLDDHVSSYRNYYSSFGTLFVFHFMLTYLCRLVLTSQTAKKVHKKVIGFKTIIIGSKDKALETYKHLETDHFSSGNLFTGFVTVNGSVNEELAELLPNLGTYNDLDRLIVEQGVEEIVIAIEPYEHEKIHDVITSLKYTDVIIKITPDLKDILLGHVKISSIFYTPLIVVQLGTMQSWQVFIKRVMDIVLSCIAMIILTPVYLFVAIGVKLSSKGPVFYTQERIGLHGKPFKMHKFRTMFVDAEMNGPMLSSDNDPRITSFGRFLRKVRLDETPQFYNVLKGTMSLVGPRPERQFFIDRIMERAPEYALLHKIKPGITSWGQVKYGYAENVDEMIERLKYDLLYLENRSLSLDIKILLYTFIIIFQGRGK